MLLPLKSCAFSARNNQVQRPNIFWWTFAFRTSVAAVSCAGRIAVMFLALSNFRSCFLFSTIFSLKAFHKVKNSEFRI